MDTGSFGSDIDMDTTSGNNDQEGEWDHWMRHCDHVNIPSVDWNNLLTILPIIVYRFVSPSGSLVRSLVESLAELSTNIAFMKAAAALIDLLVREIERETEQSSSAEQYLFSLH